MSTQREDPRRILLVDDEPDTLKVYTDILESEGYEVATAQSGERALELLDRARPDLILLDIMLPGKDGMEVAREIAEREETRDIPIVMITALDAFTTGQWLGAAPPVRRFLYKPCRPRTLLEGIEDALQCPH